MKKNKKPALKENEKYENYFQVFMRNYKNVPAFKALVKMGLFFIFAFAMILITSLSKDIDKDNKKKTTTTTTAVVEEKKNYKDSLEELMSINKFEMQITKDDITYKVNYEIKDNMIEGYLEKISGTYHFKLVEGNTYEISLGNDNINNELFEGINTNYLNIKDIISKLSKEVATKSLDNGNMLYHYKLDNVNYYITLKDEVITELKINTERVNYSVLFNEVKA